jgi:hypothetical protein
VRNGDTTPLILTSTLHGGEWWAVSSTPDCFVVGKWTPNTHWTGGWVSYRTDLDDMRRQKSLPPSGIKFRFFCCPARRLITILTEITRLNTARIYALSFLCNCFSSYVWRIPYNLLLKCQKYINFCISEVMRCNLVEYYKVLEHPDASTSRAEEYSGSRFHRNAGNGLPDYGEPPPWEPQISPVNNDLSGNRRQDVSSVIFRNNEQIRATTFNGWYLVRNVDEINVT